MIYRVLIWPSDANAGIVWSSGRAVLSSGETRTYDVPVLRYTPAVQLKAKVFVPDPSLLVALPLDELIALFTHASDTVREAALLAVQHWSPG